MKRHAAMKRTGFKRRSPDSHSKGERTRVLPVVDAGAFKLGAAAALVPVPKRAEIRSEALLAAVRKMPRCMHCHAVFAFGKHGDPAHSNWSGHGKAGAQKADDNRIACLCRGCHEMIDTDATMFWSLRFSLWWDAHVATVRWLTGEGRWPVSAPVPDLRFPSNLLEERP